MSGALRVEPPAPLVLHVIHHLVTGGMENGLVNLINHMPSGDYRHAVVCIEDYSDFRQRIQRADVNVTALFRSRIGITRLRRALFDHCRALRPAIIHTRNQSGLDALLPSRLAGVRYAVHGEHGWDVDNLRGQHWKPRLLRQLHSPLVDRYVAVSKDIERYLIHQVGIRPSRVTQVCNGVDTARFAPNGAADLSWLPESFRGDGLVRVGSVGRIQPVKNQAVLLRAFAALLRQSRALAETARLVLVGDGPLLPDLREMARSLGIEQQCYLPGAVSDVPRVLRALDLFVLPSLNEGISNTILEAMAVQLPVLASSVGGNVELVCDGSTGALFDPLDEATLVALLARYVADAGLRQLHGADGRLQAVERYSLIRMVDGYRTVYDDLLARRR